MKRPFVILIGFMLIITIFGIKVIAEDIVLESEDVTITEAGEYSISDISTENRIIIEQGIEGEVTLKISNVTIEANNGPAIEVKNGSKLNLVLEGKNNLKGADGYAGISVSASFNETVYAPDESGQVIISGTGHLECVGGNGTQECGAGSGIGGNGFDGDIGSDFGVVIINGGSIKAIGGQAYGNNDFVSITGAGSGIGSGGTKGEDDWFAAGTIIIQNGETEAIGGKGYGEFYVGAGAGIGSGGGCSNGQRIFGDNLYIGINGGKIEAYACDDSDYYGAAAGIGGSSNGSGGTIDISGGTIYAYGGNSPDNFSGAGIGSGDNAGFLDITITGGTIYAYAKDGAAAIGGGYSGFGDIEISGNASVYAYGGEYAAGIGSGFYPRFGNSDSISSIDLNTSGEIIAYGGIGANAVGLGNRPNDIKCEISIGKNTGDLNFFVNDDNTSPLAGITLGNILNERHDLYHASDKMLHWNDLSNESDKVFCFDGADILDSGLLWTDDNNKGTIRILNGSDVVTDINYEKEYRDVDHNWMILSSDIDGSSNDGSDKPVISGDISDDGIVHISSNSEGKLDCEASFGNGWIWSEEYKSCIRRELVMVDTSVKL